MSILSAGRRVLRDKHSDGRHCPPSAANSVRPAGPRPPARSGRRDGPRSPPPVRHTPPPAARQYAGAAASAAPSPPARTTPADTAHAEIDTARLGWHLARPSPQCRRGSGAAPPPPHTALRRPPRSTGLRPPPPLPQTPRRPHWQPPAPAGPPAGGLRCAAGATPPTPLVDSSPVLRAPRPASIAPLAVPPSPAAPDAPRCSP